MEQELQDLVKTPKLSPLETMRHSAAHVMAHAITKLFPKAEFGVGPHIENGFYYDVLFPEPVTEQVLPKIEKEMRKIISQKTPFVRKNLNRHEAEKFFKEHQQEFKLELIHDINEKEYSIYEEGNFTDLCRGPHVEHTGQIKAFKLTHLAGAYWRGNEKNKMLTRIYGVAFETEEELKQYLFMLEESKKRDHRKLGKELGLFSFHNEAVAMPFFHPKGALVYNLLQNLMRKMYVKYEYQEVITPLILDVNLWHRSGHYDNYKENMYFSETDGREVAMKPMNCPCHALMFSVHQHSYRELPIRFADFGRLHRYERSGVTAGLTRVRSFCQDDAHIFCTEDQIGEEVKSVVQMIREIYAMFDFKEIVVYLSTRPDKSVGTDEMWQKAEAFLAQALRANNLEFKINAKDGAFYGPKIDFNVKDAIGRLHQLSTIQLDFSLPERFDLAYMNPDNTFKRPVMIHRAVLGSLERFIGLLIEHTAGVFPFWLAPVQTRILPIADRHADYCLAFAEKLKQNGIRAEVDASNKTISAKTRETQTQKIPYMLVAGDREVSDNSFSVRKYGEAQSQTVNNDELIKNFLKISGEL